MALNEDIVSFRLSFFGCFASVNDLRSAFSAGRQWRMANRFLWTKKARTFLRLFVRLATADMITFSSGGYGSRSMFRQLCPFARRIGHAYIFCRRRKAAVASNPFKIGARKKNSNTIHRKSKKEPLCAGFHSKVTSIGRPTSREPNWMRRKIEPMIPFHSIHDFSKAYDLRITTSHQDMLKCK